MAAPTYTYLRHSSVLVTAHRLTGDPSVPVTPRGQPCPPHREGDTDIQTHCGRVTHICVVKLTIIGSDNGLSPGRRQAIIWTNAGILLIGPLGTNFIEILIGIQTFSFKKMHLKMSSAKWRPFGLGLNVLRLTEMSYNSSASMVWISNYTHHRT